MEKVLITGAGGFIGSHLVEECVRRNMKVIAFIHYNSRSSWGWLEKSDVKNDFEVIQGDIRDFDIVNKAIKGCDTIFHLAALIGIPYSYVSPIAYIRTNIEGTYNILEAAKTNGISNVNVTSTSETYGSAQYIPIDERHPVVGQSPYSATKIAADQLAISYFRTFGLPVKIIRPFNTYGPRQSGRAIIPTIITQILNGTSKLKLGNLNPTRDFTFVKDTINGFLAIANTEVFNGEIVNIGSGFEISVGNLVTLISELMESDARIIPDETRVRPDKSEVDRLYCNNSKIISNTDWKPEYDLKEGLMQTIEWLKQNLGYYKSDLYNV
jgi:NAD dependent epimerase/dehydratase